MMPQGYDVTGHSGWLNHFHIVAHPETHGALNHALLKIYVVYLCIHKLHI